MRGKDYVIVVDYTSNYFDISQLPDKKSSTVATHTKRIFSKFGIPKIIMSDNGPEFIGKGYQDFVKQWDIDHDSSSPHYPESNGLVKRTIQTVKRTLTKSFEDNQDPYLALLALKICSGPYDSLSPGTVMFNRPLRTIVPQLIPKDKKNEKLKTKMQRKPEYKKNSRSDLRERLN